MGFIKCPRCELNYMKDTDKYCAICLRELRGEEQVDEIELCSVCGESPAMPGKDMCLFCLREMNAQNNTLNGDEDDDEDTELDEDDDDIELDEEVDDIDDEAMNDALSLDEMAEDEDDFIDED
ncbi:MAG TPA: hypothetical protein GXZ91_05955 [Christensenellaceae bacterium]|jgi:hypothetical protein|nr:hypothetical protein [Christensenellaceae bacterium]